MLYEILLLKTKIAIRLLQELGIVRCLILVFMLVAMGGAMFFTSQNIAKQYPAVHWAIGFVVLVSIHSTRKDYTFLSEHFTHVRWMMTGEYSFLLLCWGLCFFRVWWLWLGIIPIAYLVAVIPQWHYTQKVKKIPIDMLAYEWIAGIRKIYYGLYIWGGLVVYGFVTQKLIVLMVLVVAMSLLICSFYSLAEPESYLLTYQLSAKGFLFHKIILLSRYWAICLLPILMGASILFYDDIGIIIAIGTVCYVMNIGVLWAKYAFYPYTFRYTIVQGIIITFCLGGMISPVYLPLPIVLIIIVRNKALKNLYQYLSL
jgi:hypothetical protein